MNVSNYSIILPSQTGKTERVISSLMNTLEEKQLSVKELAAELGRNRTYIEAMKARGFMMPGGRATLRQAQSWLVRNHPPRSERWNNKEQ